MLQKYTDSDYLSNNKDISRNCFIKKKNKWLSPFLLNLKVYTSLFFHFCNVVLIDSFVIHRFCLVMWLFTGKIGKITKLKIDLRLGINYYHFLLIYWLKNKKFLTILSFILDDFLFKKSLDYKLLLKKSYLFYFKDLELLTNYKLAKGVYFYRIEQKFFIKIFIKNVELFFLELYLASIKLNVV